MITIVFSSRKIEDSFKEHLLKTCGLPKNKIQILGYENNGEYSLTEIYNKGLNDSKNNIITFTHDDVILDTGWGRRVLKHFETNKEYGIIGVAGTKSMPSSGMWWEDRSKMYGRVSHQNEGKTWLSAYSKDLGNDLEEVVVVDGVFFSVCKDRLKSNFSEDVKGFHMYDIDFCFSNQILGVKVGVHTNIKITHKSIGMTNEQWETNRKLFAEKFKENLPVNIKRVLRKNEKLDILVSFEDIGFKSNKGDNILKVINSLKKDGHNITICTDKSKLVPNLVPNINVVGLNEPVGYKLGDGKWNIKTNNQESKSKENVLYKVSDVKFDVVHCFDVKISDYMYKLYPDLPILCTNYDIFSINQNEKIKNIQLDGEYDIIKILSEYNEHL